MNNTAPRLADLYCLLRDAGPTVRESREDPEGSEQRRFEAISKLRLIVRDELAKARGDLKQVAGVSPEMPAALRLLQLEGLRLIVADDPQKALTRLLGKRRADGGFDPLRRRGRQFVEDRRNLLIAAAVIKLVDSGKDLKAAYRHVAERSGDLTGVKPIGAGAVKKICLNLDKSGDDVQDNILLAGAAPDGLFALDPGVEK